MDMLEGETQVRDYNLERLLMLTDGVFAIAITLLAIELRPPANWDRTFIGLVNSMGVEFFAYVMSFFFVAIYWVSHRRTYRRFRRADGVLTTLNFIMLGLITLVPFASSLIAHSHPRGEPLMIYMGLVVAIGFVSALQWGYAAFLSRDILDPGVGMPLRLLVFLILLIVPSLVVALSFVAARPGNTWVYGVILAIFAVVMITRRIAAADRDR